MSDELNQTAQDWAALWKRRAKLTKWQRDVTSAQVGTISERLMQANSEIERLQAQVKELKKRVWRAEHDLERCRVELELWKRRANAQLEVTRAAMDIVNAPFQIYDGRTGQRGYRISTNEFENLEKAVKQYVDAANLEQGGISNGTNTDQK